jgi:hypothetical protein
MAKFRCVCGYVISTSGEIPNPDEWHCLSDVEFDSIAGEVSVEDVYQRTTIFYRCPKSDHLWAFWSGLGSPPTLYSPTELPVEWREE